MTDVIKLDGNIREDLGSSSAKKLRKLDRLPAVIYGENHVNTYIDIDLKQFEKEYIKGAIETRTFEIKTPKETFELICYQVDLDPVSDRPRHVDFISTKGKKEIKTLIPIRYLNRDKALGLKNGGYVNILVRKLQVYCDPKNIPSFIEVDCAPLRLKQSVKISNLELPKGVRPVSKKDLLLVRVIGRGKDTIDEQTTTATADATTTAQPTQQQQAEKK